METDTSHLPSSQGPHSASLCIGIVACRLAGLDGVSLETLKWVRVLREQGHRTVFLAGELGAYFRPGMVDPLFHFHHPYVADLHARFYREGPSDRRHLLHEMERLAAYLEDRIATFVRRFRVDVLLVENALAIPMHIPLAMALTWFLYKHPLPTIAHHHDFHWERERFRTAQRPDLLEMYFPPDLPHVKHVVINRAAGKALKARKGLESWLAPNVWDFDRPPTPPRRNLRRMLGLGPDDLLILQPTRVVPRKGVEHALDLLAHLRRGPWARALRGKRPVLVISHPAGDEGTAYLHHLYAQARRLGIPLIYLGHRVREYANHAFSLWELYAQADAMTYPSLYEGFGNALIEGVYFGLPILVNRYPIYEQDIAPHGFQFVEMAGYVTPEVVDGFVEHLRNPRVRDAAAAHNRSVAARAFSLQVVRNVLTELIPK